MLQADQCFAHALFTDQTHASAAVKALLDEHFHADDIGVLMARGEEVEELALSHKTFMPHGAVLGALVGAAAGALTLSGIGVVAAGPLFIALQGAAAGTAVGTLTGTLGGLGFWRDEVNFPSDAFAKGAVLVGVITNAERTNDARRILAGAGAEKTYVSTKAEAAAAMKDRASAASTPQEAGKQMKQQREAQKAASH
jgi:hypothetical protein